MKHLPAVTAEKDISTGILYPMKIQRSARTAMITTTADVNAAGVSSTMTMCTGTMIIPIAVTVTMKKNSADISMITDISLFLSFKDAVQKVKMSAVTVLNWRSTGEGRTMTTQIPLKA